MSTRSSLWTYDCEFGGVHLYQEMHDELVHLEIVPKDDAGRDRYDYINMVLPDHHWQTLLLALGGTVPKELPF